MKTKLKQKIITGLILVAGFVFLLIFRYTGLSKLGQSVEKNPELNKDRELTKADANDSCAIQQTQEEGDDYLFVGCNGFF